MSKGGSTTSSTEIPAWLENAAIENINKGRDVSEIGYTPYYGPEVAAFNPMQQQSMQSTGSAASAFGLAPQGFDATAGIPQAQTFAGGIQGYSSAPLYEEALSQLQQNRQGQYNAINNMFIDPYSGADAGNYAASPEQVAQMFDRTPTNQPDYSINIDNSAVGGAGGTASGGAGGSGGFGGSASSSDLTGGDTFIGDDGGTYTVGYGDGMVDPGLANATANNNGYNELMGTGDALAGIAGNLLDSTMYGQIYEGITDKPLAGGSPNAPVSELSNADVADSRFGGINGYQDYNPNLGGAGGLVDRGGLMGATTTPYPESNITGGPNAGYDLMSGVTQPTVGIDINAEYDLQTRLRDEELKLEADEADRIAKAKAADMAKDAAAAKATAAKIAKDKAAYQKAQADKASAAEKARLQIEAQLAAEADAAAAKKKADAAAAKKAADAAAKKKADAAAKKKADEKKATTGGKNTGTVGDSAGNVIKDSAGNAVKFGGGSSSSGGGGSSSSGGSSAGGSGGGTYCCTKMRENGKWTSNRRVYKMHKWHFEQPQWWRDGYNVWGKVIADNLLSKDGEFSASVMNDFYEHRVNGGKFTPKAALAHVAMYPAIFAIGMVAKVTGKHITSVTITS